MTSTNDIHDVVVIGGGPAGSTAATLLQQNGHQVTLLEKENFPREHVGESLLPFCYDIFEQLGVLDQMTNRFVRKPGVRFVDAEGTRATSWCFNHVIHDESYLSFQVTRSEFDMLLLDNARTHGATVCEATRVQQVDLDGPDGTAVVTAVGPSGDTQRYPARFVLDASGRNAFMATKNGWRQKFEGLDRTALWTHWEQVNMIGGLEEGLSIIVYLGGEKKGWIWVFPLGTDRLTIGVVLNNQHIREQKSALEDAGAEDWTLDLYTQELMESPFVQQVLAGARTTSPLKVEGDYSYYVDKDKKYGRNFALVGDASTFIDPIFSSGIFLSMNGSRLVSEAIHVKLTDGDEAGDAALTATYKKIDGAYGLVHNLIRLYYNPHAINFAEAGGFVSSDHLQHENAMAAGHYLLAGDFFERYEEYGKFFDLLENPKHFEKFKHTIIDREEYQVPSCDTDPNIVFPALREEQETPSEPAIAAS